MKLLTTILPLLCATLATSRSLYDSSSQQALNPNFKVPGDNPLTFCADPSTYPVRVDSVDLSPDPPKPGETLNIKASGTVEKEISEGAKVELRVKYNFITLINKSYDLCEHLPEIGIDCPLKEGDMKVDRDADIPSIVPPGKYDVFAKVVDKDGNDVLCMEGSVTFRPHVG